ncbi:hypothetical protein SELMODRAFT_421976 [Selaginella moellendorffii]|uniref:Uncharacterized protein n=1 Tax=Selaginella moellendorffii TaxID=88036 RepID=D8SGY8_SELML|nr:hypothetical protein SELMODRAFT_421976 [Selaginella moellendorffii]
MRANCKAFLLESIPRCKSDYPLVRLKGDVQGHYTGSRVEEELDEVAMTLEPEEEKKKQEKAMVDVKKWKKATTASIQATWKAQAPASNAKAQGVNKSSSSGKLKMGGGKLSELIRKVMR